MALPQFRILSAVPQTWQARLEIAKAIRALATQEEETLLRRRAVIAAIRRDCVLVSEMIRHVSRECASLVIAELQRGGFNPEEPRVPPGYADGGQWTKDDGSSGFNNSSAIVTDATPNNNGIPGAQYVANDTPGIGHNQGPLLEDPPEIPPTRPGTPQAINAFVKAAAFWLATAGKTAAARFLVRLQGIGWLTDVLPYIYAYIYPPKTLSELQKDAQNPQPGYQIHHIVEKKTAKDDGYSDDKIEAPDNLVRIPTLTHWQITTWYQTKNDQFGGVSPRDYLRAKSWEERTRVGEDALTMFGVLKP